MAQPHERYRTFQEFYPFYLTEHVNPVSRRLHVVGTSLVVLCLIAAGVTMTWQFLVAAPLIGYGFA
ncbi:MAG TPA: Mpo1-like protein, partial [Hyphomonadaceae bacterium]|nr:Mpo1-like protein [Hyphomonadaceae bacterium]